MCGLMMTCDVVCVFFCPGLNVEGLYRMGGQTEEVMKIKADFDRGEHPLSCPFLCVFSGLCSGALQCAMLCLLVQLVYPM